MFPLSYVFHVFENMFSTPEFELWKIFESWELHCQHSKHFFSLLISIMAGSAAYNSSPVKGA